MMRTSKRMRRAILPILAASAMALHGCGRADDTIPIGPAALDDEAVAAIRSEDRLVDQDEAGSDKVTRPAAAKGRKKSR